MIEVKKINSSNFRVIETTEIEVITSIFVEKGGNLVKITESKKDIDINPDVYLLLI